MIASPPLSGMHLQIDLLAGSHLRDENLGGHGSDRPVLLTEFVNLSADGSEYDIFRVNIVIDV